MAELPPEILSKILIHTCKDGGATACTIRQVSKTMRDLIEPYRFRNIAIFGEQPLALLHSQLAAWLFDKHGNARPGREVHHLLVCNTQLQDLAKTWSFQEMLQHLMRWAYGTPLEPISDHLHSSAFSLLLLQITRLCAPYLLSYNVVLSSDAHNGPYQWIAPVTYPNLASLSIRCKTSETLFEPTPDTRASLPALRELHVHCDTDFFSAGPLSIATPSTKPIDLMTFHGPADSYIYTYAIERFHGSLPPEVMKSRSLELRFTPAAPSLILLDGRSVASENLLRELTLTDDTLHVK